MNHSRILSSFFLVSGFCALLYQLVFLRLAFSAFGVITPIVSIVLSVFMLGLGVGGWLGGRYIENIRQTTKLSAIIWYGIAEITIGLGAYAVPATFSFGRDWLLAAGQASSVQYLLWSALFATVSLLPWTLAMGTTFVFGMAFLREFPNPDHRTFGILYVANVVGAVLGTVITAFVLIEMLGFRHTLQVASLFNFIIGTLAIAWGLKLGSAHTTQVVSDFSKTENRPVEKNYFLFAILFLTGFATMAMEVVWTRAFTPVLGPFVYSFALLLTVYLSSTAVGSLLYRMDVVRNRIKPKEQLTALSAIFAFLPIVMTDPRLSDSWAGLLALISISPISGAVGYLTPMLVDELSEGKPEFAGRAYATNVVGCVLGPLFSGYVLLPVIGTKQSLLLLALPFLMLSGAQARNSGGARKIAVAFGTVLMVFSLFCNSWEDGSSLPNTVQKPQVIRDHVATTIACNNGISKSLLVNGTPMTYKEPSTQMMAHLPLAFRRTPAKSVLVICFGMGTTFRSALSWNIPVTAVDLVPGVPKMFSYFWNDAAKVLHDMNGKIIIDDGRRFLARTNQKFDIITIDPPQPLPAAGSSLLYSSEFYQTLKQHLNADGILQEYMPRSDDVVLSAVTRSIGKTFKYLKINYVLGKWGYHIFAADEPFPDMTAEQLLSQLPPAAVSDFEELVESPDKLTGLKKNVETVLNQRVSIPETLAKTPEGITVDDDRPLNEYYLLRKYFGSSVLH